MNPELFPILLLALLLVCCWACGLYSATTDSEIAIITGGFE